MSVIDHPDDRELRQRLVALTCDLVGLPRDTVPELVRDQVLTTIQHHVQGLEGLRWEILRNGGIPSLVVLPEGVDEPEVMLLGHADVVEHANPDDYRAEVLDGRIVGPGAGDMKGQLAILLELFLRTHLSGARPSLGLVVTTDEETGGEAGVGWLFGERGLRAGMVINPDGGALNEVTAAEKGLLHLGLRCGGRSGHAARPWTADNAMTRLLERLAALRASFVELQTDPEHWHPTCEITRVGTDNLSTNRIPARAWAAVDVRFPPPWTRAGMMARVRETLGPEIEIDTAMGADPVTLNPDPDFLACCEEICGAPPVIARDDGASDSRFIVAQGIPVIMSRPTIGNMHARDEWIDIDSMVVFYRVCARYLERKLT